MNNFWDHLDEVSPILKSNKIKLLLLDFDGTLSPIVSTPKKAIVPQRTKELLHILSNKDNYYLGVISGRNLVDLKNKINLSNIIYAGNHGIKGEIYQKKFLYPVTKEVLVVLNAIKKDLKQLADQYSGILIEDKKPGISFHFRLLEGNQLTLLKSLFNKIMLPYLKQGLISIVSGKKVFDIRPKVNWHKGYFVKMLIDHISKTTNSKPLTIYIGDDKTDEDVFLYLPRNITRNITIKIGKNKSGAKYYLKNQGEVVKFLEWLNSSF